MFVGSRLRWSLGCRSIRFQPQISRPLLRCFHVSGSYAATEPKAAPEVTVAVGVDGQKVIIPKNVSSRLPPGVRRKKDERPSAADREAELKQRAAAARKLAESVPNVIAPELKKPEKWSLFEVPTKKGEAASSSSDVKQRSIDKTEKKKSEAASLDANFKPAKVDAESRSKEADENEKERLAVASAMKEWDDLMERNIINAISVRANCHETGGARVTKSKVLARQHFKRAAEMGCAESQFRYALLCFLGEGGDLDMSDSYNFMLTAAKNGHPEALWRCGLMLYQPEYEKDFGIVPDHERARQFIVKSAELGSIDAYEQLSVLYRDGIGGEKNIGEAEGWLLRFEETMRDKRLHPHKYQRRWFKKKGDKPVMAMLKQQMSEGEAETVADTLTQQKQAAKQKAANQVSFGGSRRR